MPQGFKKAVRDNLELRLGDQVQQDFTLAIGAVTEQVTVSAGTELLLQTNATDKAPSSGRRERARSRLRRPVIRSCSA